jgi:hypothetical protein
MSMRAFPSPQSLTSRSKRACHFDGEHWTAIATCEWPRRAPLLRFIWSHQLSKLANHKCKSYFFLASPKSVSRFSGSRWPQVGMTDHISWATNMFLSVHHNDIFELAHLSPNCRRAPTACGIFQQEKFATPECSTSFISFVDCCATDLENPTQAQRCKHCNTCVANIPSDLRPYFQPIVLACQKLVSLPLGCRSDSCAPSGVGSRPFVSTIVLLSA